MSLSLFSQFLLAKSLLFLFLLWLFIISRIECFYARTGLAACADMRQSLGILYVNACGLGDTYCGVKLDLIENYINVFVSLLSCLQRLCRRETVFSQPVVPEVLCSSLGSSHVKDYVIMPLVSKAHGKALYCLSCVFCIFCLQDIVIVVKGCLRTIRNWL